MKKDSEAFVGLDTAKRKHAIALAEGGRAGEVRYIGEIDSAPATVERVLRKLGRRYEKLHFCYEVPAGRRCAAEGLDRNTALEALPSSDDGTAMAILLPPGA
jgi:hypothetical protein